MKTINRLIQSVCMALVLVSFTACGQTTTSLKEVMIKSDFASDHCKNRIEEAIGQEKGVKSVVADIKTQTVLIKFDTTKNTATSLAASVKNLGYASNVMCEKKEGAACPKDPSAKCCAKEGDTCCKKATAQKCKIETDQCKKDTTKTACAPGCQKPCCKK